MTQPQPPTPDLAAIEARWADRWRFASGRAVARNAATDIAALLTALEAEQAAHARTRRWAARWGRAARSYWVNWRWTMQQANYYSTRAHAAEAAAQEATARAERAEAVLAQIAHDCRLCRRDAEAALRGE